MNTLSGIRLFALAGAVSALAAAAPARASVYVDGVTYSLTETTVTKSTAQFDLHMSGTEGHGINAFAVSQPDNFLNATAPSGFAYFLGGLSATGCSGDGAHFFCFQAETAPTTPTGSTVDLLFGVTLSSGSFADYAADLKIEWALGDSHYDIVSMRLCPDPAVVPEPVSSALLGTGLLSLGVVRRRRARS